ncbi:MAG: amidase family protein [Variovorax sp.]
MLTIGDGKRQSPAFALLAPAFQSRYLHDRSTLPEDLVTTPQWPPVAAVASAAGNWVDLDRASIADLNAAFKTGSLCSEQLVQMCLARIEAYDKQGPRLNAIITLNASALRTARELDRERGTSGPRSLLHGIPVVLKDNLDTFDMATTCGSVLLKGSVPPDDAFIVKRLRDAGAVILAKVNMSEFASAGTFSSILGQSRNPHDLARSPAGSSNGTAVAIAATYAPLGLGTDTGGSIRGPAAANGIAALKPTLGLLSRDGLVPLALSLDTPGPMARNVYDLAVSLGIMAGVDPGDAATAQCAGRNHMDYTSDLDPNALNGARLGVARDFMGLDSDVDWIAEAGYEAMARAGATLVDVHYPKWLIDAKDALFHAIRLPEFKSQIANYLATTGAGFPKSLGELIARTALIHSPDDEGHGTNPGRWAQFKLEENSSTLEDYRYTAVRDHGLPLIRAVVDGILAAQSLDAIVYPTAPRRPVVVAGTVPSPSGLSPGSATNIASLAGCPDLVVPAGFTGDGLPVGMSFLGLAFSEAKLLSLGFSFEHHTRARRAPVHTPTLPGDWIRLP